MHSLDDLAEQFRACQDRAARLVKPLSHVQFNWRPAAESWSVAECLVHLNVTARAVVAKMRPAIERGRTDGISGTGTFTVGWFSRWFEAEMEPPPRRRTRSPEVFRIASGSDHAPDDVMRTYAETGAEWQALLDSARGLDLGRLRVTSPVTRLLRIPLGSYLRISVAHERRHLWQAEQVAVVAGFPPG